MPPTTGSMAEYRPADPRCAAPLRLCRHPFSEAV